MHCLISDFFATNNQLYKPSVFSTSISTFPDELILGILANLNRKELLSACLVCHHWKMVSRDPTTELGKYLNKIHSIQKLPSIAANFSAWEPMPKHWEILPQNGVLKFSSITSDIIAFHNCYIDNQSSKFFSFNYKVPISDQYILLNQYQNTYFITPQSKTDLKLAHEEDLEPLQSFILKVVDIRNPNKMRELSLLGKLPRTEENLQKCQIQFCFPLSENKFAIITKEGMLSFWNLLNDEAHCYKELFIKNLLIPNKMGNYLICEEAIVNIDKLILIEHGLKLEPGEVFKSSNTAFCAYNYEKNRLRFFTISEEGILAIKWELPINRWVKNPLNNTFGHAVAGMNENYIIFTYWQSRSKNLEVLNLDGDSVLSIEENLQDTMNPHYYHAYPIFAKLSDDILIFKNPQTSIVSFWHIPTKNLITRLDWSKSVVSFDKCDIQDICFSEGKLTFLQSQGNDTVGDKSAQFRLIQFDSLKT